VRKEKQPVKFQKCRDKRGRTGFLQQRYFYSVICEASKHESLFPFPVLPTLKQKTLKNCPILRAKEEKTGQFLNVAMNARTGKEGNRDLVHVQHATAPRTAQSTDNFKRNSS